MAFAGSSIRARFIEKAAKDSERKRRMAILWGLGGSNKGQPPTTRLHCKRLFSGPVADTYKMLWIPSS